MLKKKIWANFQRIVEVFTQKIFNTLKYMGLGSEIWDPRSGIRKKPIPDPVSRGSKRHRIGGSRIPDPDPQHWILVFIKPPINHLFKQPCA